MAAAIDTANGFDDLDLVIAIYHRAEQLLADNRDTDPMYDGIAATLRFLRDNGVDLSPVLHPGHS